MVCEGSILLDRTNFYQISTQVGSGFWKRGIANRLLFNLHAIGRIYLRKYGQKLGRKFVLLSILFLLI